MDTTCPICGSSITISALEAWCNQCDWRITKDDPGSNAYRQTGTTRSVVDNLVDDTIQEITTPITPTPMELRARREALGLSQQQLAAMLNVNPSTLEHWESNQHRILGIRPELDVAEALLQDLTNMAYLSGRRDGQLTTYLTDDDWWADNPQAKALHLPAVMHRIAAARAATTLHQEGITATINKS